VARDETSRPVTPELAPICTKSATGFIIEPHADRNLKESWRWNDLHRGESGHGGLESYCHGRTKVLVSSSRPLIEQFRNQLKAVAFAPTPSALL
jgi:hypothetical protein